ncbi:MAG: hypothetical protein ABI870_11680, partial [Rhodanobacter sp.]
MTCRITLLLALMVVAPLSAHAANTPPLSLLPMPAQISVDQGSFSVDARTSIVVTGRDQASR